MSISDVLREKGNAVVKTRPDDSVLAAVRLLADKRIGALVVEDAWMHPVGIFTERDFLNAVGHHGAEALSMTVGKLMSAPLVTCAPSDRVESVMATMTKAKIRHVPVIEDGKLRGIVSIGDLVKHRLDEKELETHVLLDLTRMRA